MSRYLLGVVTQSLQGVNPAQCPIFNRTIEWTQALLEFYMYAQYKCHDDASLSYMVDALHNFLTIKDVLLLRRASKKTKANANALKAELVKKQMADQGTNTDIWTLSKKRCEMNAWLHCIGLKLDIFKESEADFDFPKIQLMSHWANHVRQYGAWQQ
jgi:hypothetical protein